MLKIAHQSLLPSDNRRSHGRRPFTRPWRYFAAILVCLLPSQRVAADEIPPNFAEKTVTVEIREAEIHIEFRVGVSLRDMQSICEKAKLPVAEETPSELMRQFSELIAPEVTRQLTVEIDGKKMELQPPQVTPGRIHHVSTTLEFSIPFKPSGEVTNLKIVDHSFTELGGAIRLACKTRGEAMLRRCNVPVAIVRAKRFDYSSSPPAERETASTIEAQILISD